MAVQPVAFTSTPLQLTGSATVFYTVPSSPAAVLLIGGRVRFTNTDSSTRSVTAYAVPNGSSVGASTAFMNAEGIAANAHVDVDLPVIGAGGTYQALADVTAKVTVLQLGGALVS